MPERENARAPVTLLMAIHCHQPVGNFDFVFEDAYAKSYDPFLQVLEHHPTVRLTLHYSGCLLDWLMKHRPEFLARVRRLVASGQVELLASGYYEPILPLLPEMDRQGQIAQMRTTLRTRFGVDAEGLWLTERVWEPELPATLAQAGIRYTMIDVNQFSAAKPWLPTRLQVHDEAFWDVLESYTTEYAGSSVRVFPASKRLRYWMPFRQVRQTMDFLQRLKDQAPVAISFADDGEKFGLWPKTHQWVYNEGWLDQFFTALEQAQSWLATATFQDYTQRVSPQGRVSLPCGSYEEMLEWSGGHFRNFFTKYPEANALYHYMLRVSQQLQQVESSELRVESSRGRRVSRRRNSQLATHNSQLLKQAKHELYQGQCNCAYWHGVFGGLYLSHLRRAVYSHLIAAETFIRQLSRQKAGLTILDADGDGCQEACLTTPAMSVVVDPDEGGTVTDWTVFGSRINLLDTLSRRPEPYHDRLKIKQLAAAAAGAPASIHDILGAKEDDLASHVVYDDHRRSGFLDYGLQSLPSLQEVVRCAWTERQLWSSGSCQWRSTPASRTATGPLSITMIRQVSGGRIDKTVSLDRQRPVLECLYRLERVSAPVVGIEWNFSLRDERYLRQPQQAANLTEWTIEEAALGLGVRVSFDPAALVFQFPIETVSESEGGLERTYQGLCLVCLWTVNTPSWQTRIRLELVS